jgi:patatin-like phospholipase/acyl hydrolase
VKLMACELIVVERIMEDIKRRQALSNEPIPSEYFDIISGSGVGGLVAILLGKLNMVWIK